MIRVTNVADAIETIYKLDCLAYPEEMTDKQWYFDRYKGEETVYVYEMSGLDIGYLIVADTKRAMYEAVINGVLDGDVIVSHNMFRGDKQYFYIASTVVDPKYRHQGIFSELLDYANIRFTDKLKFALVNEHTRPAFLAKGFIEVNQNGHYCSVIKY